MGRVGQQVGVVVVVVETQGVGDMTVGMGEAEASILGKEERRKGRKQRRRNSMLRRVHHQPQGAGKILLE